MEPSALSRDEPPPAAAEAGVALAGPLEGEIAAALVEVAPLAVIDAEGRVLFANGLFCALTKQPREALLGREHPIIRADQHGAALFGDLWATVAGGRTWRGEIEHRAGDGTHHWADTSIVPLPAAPGEPRRYLTTHSDITAVKQMERSLRESEKRYHDLVQMSPDAIILHDGGTITFVNEAGLRLLRASRPDQVLGRTPYDVFHPDYHERIRGRVATLMSRPGPLPSSEQVLVALDGTEVPIEVNAVSYQVQGRLIVQAACRDISARKETERKLLETLDYADTVLNSLPGVFYHYDETLRMVRWNPNFERISGYSAAELAGMQPADFFAEDEKALVMSRVAEVFEKGESAVEAHFLLKDGRRIPYLFTGRRCEHEGGQHLVGVGIDISERERAESVQREMLARFHAAARATRDVVWDWDLATDAIWWSENFQILFGHPPKEIEPTIESWNRRIHPDDRDRVTAHILGVIAGDKEIWFDEYRFRRKDGSYADVFDRGHVLRDASGRGVRMVGAIQDISERKQAQARLLAFNAELEQRVARRTQELQTLNHELETFCYSVSHDLRAPLRAIAGFSEILAKNHAGGLDETARNYLGRVLAATHRMGDLIDDLLNLSRVSRDEMRRETVDLSTIAREVIANLQQAAPERQVAIAVDDGLSTMGDARLLRIMLENLLGNAWKFTSRTPAARIGFTGRSENGVRTFAVSDNGAGFDMRYAGKLFGPFQRLHRLTEFPGTGIGLATVQRIVGRHGGRITAQAEPNKGATFRFSF